MIYWLFLFLSTTGFADFEIPKGLNASDRIRTMEVIGLGTTSKFLSNAYPLGGYDGLEVSMSIESINVEEITQLGNTSPHHNSVFYPKFTVGKGLFNDSDIFFHFIPFNETTGISKYGLTYRWGFYQARFLPLNFSVIVHANSANLDNGIVTRNLGVDLTTGLNLGDFSIFFGGGWASSTGDFSIAITDSNNKERAKAASSHFVFGATYNFSPFFIGFSVDRYKDAVFNGKAGLLF